MKEYLSLASMLLLAFGLIFELPCSSPCWPHRYRLRFFSQEKPKVRFLLSFVVAAILTPTPDIVNQLLMAGPLMVLYEISILGARIFGKKETVEEEDEPPEGKGEDVDEKA
jgi:sec-independent protein translocase protein TatC